MKKSVLIIAPEYFPTHELQAPLQELDIEVTVSTSDAAAFTKAADLVVYFCTEEEGLKFNKLAVKNGLTWIPVTFSHSIGRIGPLVIPNQTACYKCFTMRMRSNGVPELKASSKLFNLSFSLFAKIVAIEIVKWFTKEQRSFSSNLINHMIEFNAFTLEGVKGPVHYVPTCPDCGIQAKRNPELQFLREKSTVMNS